MKKLIILLSMMILLSSFVSAVPDVTSNLVSYWSFDVNADDDFSTNDLSVTGGTPTQWSNSSCRSGNCYYFDGGDGFFNTAMTGASAGNVERTTCGFMTTYLAYSAHKGVWGIGTGTGAGNTWNFGTDSGNDFGLLYYQSGGDVPAVFEPVIGTEYFVCITYAPSTSKMYVDGSHVYDAAHAISISNNDFYVGRFAYEVSYITAVLDEITYYQRALSLEDVQELYALDGNPIPPVIDTSPQQVINLVESATTPVTINISWDYVSQTTGGANISVDGSNNDYVAYPIDSYIIISLEQNTEYNITVLATNASGTNYTNSTENNILVTTDLYAGVVSNASNRKIVFTDSFDINASINGTWKENPDCNVIDNVSWLSCEPVDVSLSISNSTVYTCTPDSETTGDVDVYVQCDSVSHDLVNSSSGVYSFFSFNTLMNDSLIFLPFNNTIQDFSVNLVATWMENNGVLSTPVYGVGWLGKANNALDTNMTDYLLMNGSDMSFSASNTMSFWVNADNSFSTDDGLLANTKFGDVIYNSTTTILSYSVNTAGGLVTIISEQDLADRYTFITVSCDNSLNVISLYVNSTLVNSSGSTTCTELA